ncbi:MAG TPA: SAM-dependent methyltransferase [Pyrinomonadaceae bacterium]|nr:SAM-dependent methyltransferase [Pyrinomonadaceae bacterium]
MNSNSTYPSREEHNLRWEELAREIAANRESLSENPESAENRQGSLIILGSGIQGVGFNMEAVGYIKAADKVFYCVSNPPTQVWLHQVRPDAYDLYVLYDDTKPRFNTYMQMSEAMLHYVRQGERVVGVYYGHPGVFVLSTHRAIAIARREGYYAVMKPGISALDCLCADLGIDPAYPGMQTFEASELLLRKRVPDTTVHLVLWQVGLIGEQGYRRKGFINDKFPVLIEYLQKYYGDDFEVTHYIAARHPTFEPTIAVHKLSELLDPRVRATLTGISTFYIPPKDAAQTDVELAARLGFVVRPGQKLSKLNTTRAIAAYSPKELAAIAQFENFRVPNEYQYQAKTRAGEFLVELNDNIALQDIYRDNPALAVSEEYFPGLSSLEKNLLSTRNENHAHVAAKGSVASHSAIERLIIDIHKEQDVASAFRATLVANYQSSDGPAAINSWMSAQGYGGAALEQFVEANEDLKASMLLSWSGVYLSPDEKLVLTIIGSPDLNELSVVYANTIQIKGFTFNNSTLIWKTKDGNPNNAVLVFKIDDRESPHSFLRSVSGKYWANGDDEPTDDNLSASEVLAGANPLSVWTARYETRVTTDGANWHEGPAIAVIAPRPDQSPNEARLLIEEITITDGRFEDNAISWGRNRINFAQDPDSNGRKVISGALDGYWPGGANLKGASVVEYDDPFRGRYSTYEFDKGVWKRNGDFNFAGSAVHLGQSKIEKVVFRNNWLTWSHAGGAADNGEIQFSIDPTSQVPKFVGYVWTGNARPKNPNIQGTFALDLNNSAACKPPAPVGVTNLPAKIFEVLCAISLAASDPATLFIWSRWQRACFTSRLVNSLAPKIVDVIVGNEPAKSRRRNAR